MVGCDLSYGLEPSGNTDTDKAAAGNTSIVENFLPAYRTFKIYPLRSNSTYWLYMTCKVSKLECRGNKLPIYITQLDFTLDLWPLN